MNHPSPRQHEDNLQLAERAAEWIDILEHPSAAERQEFVEWLAASPRHGEEILFMTALMEQLRETNMRALANLQELLNSAPNNVTRLHVGANAASPAPDCAKPRSMRPPRSVRLGIGLAAAVAAIAISGWLLAVPQTFSTEIGEQRTVKLSDGSLVDLNTQSKIRVRISNSTREIRLVQGEALFVVRHDSTRPFRVLVDDTVVQAIGTQFDVYRRERGTTIAVVEGRVSVTSPTRGSVEPTLLAAGEAASIAGGGRIAKRALPDQSSDATAWRQHRSVFLSSTLADIAAEFNRYNKTPKITIRDPVASERRYTGTLDSSDPQSLIGFLREDPELEVSAQGASVVVGSRAKADR